MRRFLIILAAALGMLIPGACGRSEPEEVVPVDLKDLLFNNSEVKKGLAIDSKAMKMQMKYDLYLPPKFDAEKAYPILYLLHGAGDNQDAWLDKGDAQKIADNYIKNQGGTPMIIVMPDAQMTFYTGNFETYMHEELMPEVEGKYKFSGKRAVAGLSMGGFHTLYTTLNNPDMFNYSGMFSAAIGTGSEETAAHKEIYENVDGKLATFFSKKPAMLWIGIGRTDFLIESNNEFRAKLDAAGYPYKYMETDGGHIWRNWRIYLSEFVPLLFK